VSTQYANSVPSSCKGVGNDKAFKPRNRVMKVLRLEITRVLPIAKMGSSLFPPLL